MTSDVLKRFSYMLALVLSVTALALPPQEDKTKPKPAPKAQAGFLSEAVGHNSTAV